MAKEFFITERINCPKCNGKDNKCSVCKGGGKIKRQVDISELLKELLVDVPGTSHYGKVIRKTDIDK